MKLNPRLLLPNGMRSVTAAPPNSIFAPIQSPGRMFVSSLIITWCVLCGGCIHNNKEPLTPAPRLSSSVPAQVSTVKPLIIEWSSADRGALENRMQQGTVAIRIESGEIVVLNECPYPGKYTYRGFTRKLETQVITTEGELDATFSMGAAKLGTALHRFGKLYVSLSLVGQWEAALPDERGISHIPGCEGATHVVQSASVGAFRFYSGEEKSMEADVRWNNIGPSSGMLNSSVFSTADGDFDSCEQSTAGALHSPEGCSALVRLQLLTIGDAPQKKVIPSYQLGRQPFLFSDLVRFNDNGEESTVSWKRGPYPEALCNDIFEQPQKPIFSALYTYCRMHKNEAATVEVNGAQIQKSVDWYMYNLPAQNPYEEAFNRFEEIRQAIRPLPPSRQDTYERILLNMIAVRYWRTKTLATEDSSLPRMRAMLQPLEDAVSVPIVSDEAWWAAHLLTVADITDYSNALAKINPFRFATKWHVLLATELVEQDALNIYPALLDELDTCDPYRIDVLLLYAHLLLEQGDVEGALKHEIEADRASEVMGFWEFPGTQVFQQSQYLGLQRETENYLQEYPWVLGDFLWSRATDCFIHEDYLCVRQSLYRILENAPASPLVPTAYQAVIEWEYAMGNHAAAFALKMKEPRWSATSDWGKRVRAVPSCPMSESDFQQVIRTARGGNLEQSQFNRENYVLVGRNLENWQALLNVGSALRECRFLAEDVSGGWIKIEKDAGNKGRLRLNVSAGLVPMKDCVKNILLQEWQQKEFQFSAQVDLPRSPPWHMDPATGWSKETRFQLACDAGEVEGCFQLALLLAAEANASPKNRHRATQLFERCCDAGHVQACEHTSSP